MKTGIENHRPWVEFDEVERAEMDAEFFANAAASAAALTARQVAYFHNARSEIIGLAQSINFDAVHSGGNLSNAMLTLTRIAAVAARNARLVKWRMGRDATAKPLEASIIPAGMSGHMQEDADGKKIPGSGQ